MDHSDDHLVSLAPGQRLRLVKKIRQFLFYFYFCFISIFLRLEFVLQETRGTQIRAKMCALVFFFHSVSQIMNRCVCVGIIWSFSKLTEGKWCVFLRNLSLSISVSVWKNSDPPILTKNGYLRSVTNSVNKISFSDCYF